MDARAFLIFFLSFSESRLKDVSISTVVLIEYLNPTDHVFYNNWKFTRPLFCYQLVAFEILQSS